MAMVTASCSHLFCSVIVFFLSIVSSSNASTLLLQQHSPLGQRVYLDLVSSSLVRALRLKNPQTTTVPLMNNVIGVYNVPLRFGTPPQNLTFVMDTGSNFVWHPCSSRYICKNCSLYLPTPTTKIRTFIPTHSSSSRIVSCRNPKCSWINHRVSRCHNETDRCSPYFILYSTGDTSGFPILDTLRLRDLTVPDFLMGCSTITTAQPAGIAGLGRGPASFSSQLNLTKFSYCSQSINNQSAHSNILLDYSHTGSGKKTKGMVYTPFLKNPRIDGKSAYLAYYYVGLRRITLGGKKVRVPYKYLTPDQFGNGGAVIDSGSPLTFLTRGIFDPLSNELISQMNVRGHKRNIDAEISGLSPCFDVLADDLSFPKLKFHFKGGTVQLLRLENYMAPAGNDSTTLCLAFTTDQGGGEEGPAVVLGNFQFQNFYIEYDLSNERLGFKRQRCK